MYSDQMLLVRFNTVPNFSFNSLATLFTTVRKYLTKEGIFLFSNYKIPNQNQLPALLNRRQGHSGKLLLELGSGSIAAEYYDLPAVKTEYGAYIVTYVCYNTFSRDYTLKKRELFRSSTEFILHQNLQNIFESCGFSIEIFNNSGHSFVYGLVKT